VPPLSTGSRVALMGRARRGTRFRCGWPTARPQDIVLPTINHYSAFRPPWSMLPRASQVRALSLVMTESAGRLPPD
jgi:hypothetical protein